MDPRDVNRINYNNYFVGQNLDFLVRSKMRSESLSTPLKNTPAFYDDQVTSKMTLLGKRGSMILVIYMDFLIQIQIKI